ncbi:MAG: FliH/SctL family protein [Candidatus Saganbacteria bacterium]|nr:FliH/SctL family protein [Candidatus Saganbacteria bacterium]
MALIKRSQVIERGCIDLKTEVPAIRQQPSADFSGEEAQAFEEIKEEIVSHTVDEAYEKTGEIIAQAQAEAKELLKKANQEAETLFLRTKEEAVQAGKAEGEASVSENITASLETLNNAIKERKRIIKDSEGEILRLSLKIAEQVIRSEVSLHKDVVMNIVAEAVNKVSDRENVIIKVNREDAEHIKKYKDRLSGIVDGVKNLSIIEDSQVEPGGCVIETNLGFVDARVSTKLSLIEQSLMKAQASVTE